jgi:ankyrin repeat protein
MSASSKDEKNLLKAAEKGKAADLRMLLEKNVNVNVTDSKGRSVLYKATEKGKLEALQVVAEKGADASLRDKNSHFTPLHVAALHGSLEIATLIIEKCS